MGNGVGPTPTEFSLQVKNIQKILCPLLLAKPRYTGQARGEKHALAYPHSKAGTTSIEAVSQFTLSPFFGLGKKPGRNVFNMLQNDLSQNFSDFQIMTQPNS